MKYSLFPCNNAKVKGVITGEDFHLVSILKIIRNQESYDNISAAVIAGFAIVMSLCLLVHKLAKGVKDEVLGLKDSLSEEASYFIDLNKNLIKEEKYFQ